MNRQTLQIKLIFMSCVALDFKEKKKQNFFN
jgi:hypothetical protein